MPPEHDSSPTGGPVRLDYGRAPSRRRRWLRRIAIVLCMTVMGVASWRWGPQAWRQARILYWQRQCLRYSASADQVVYTTDVAVAAGLLKRADYGRGEVCSLGSVGADGRFRTGSNSRVEPNTAAYRSECWDQFLRAAAVRLPRFSFMPAGAVCFLGEMRTPRGKTRLVVVEGFRVEHYQLSIFFHAFVLEPGGLLRAPKVTGPAQGQGIDVSDFPYSATTGSDYANSIHAGSVYAGQIDPADRSHFTIRFRVVGGSEEILDGRIDNQDYVTLIPRKTPPPVVR
jgi:hypothetical protein